MPSGSDNGVESPRYGKKSQRPSPVIHLVHFRYHNPGDLQLRLLHCATARLVRWNHPDLSAPYWRLYLHVEPGASVHWAGETHALCPGNAYLIAPETGFATSLSGQVTQYFVHFTLTPALICDPGVYPVSVTAEMRSLLALATRNYEWEDVEGGEPGCGPWEEETAGEVSPEKAVIAWNALALLALGGLGNGVLRERRLDVRVLRVLEHIERHVAAKHSLEDFARIAGMHPRAFIRLFREETGITPMACLLNRRVAMACDMLHHTSRSIDEIAAATGFYDRYHFSNTFRRLREVTPAEFRNLHRR